MKRMMLMGILALATLLVAAACSSDDPTATPTKAPAPAAAPAPASAPVLALPHSSTRTEYLPVAGPDSAIGLQEERLPPITAHESRPVQRITARERALNREREERRVPAEQGVSHRRASSRHAQADDSPPPVQSLLK